MPRKKIKVFQAPKGMRDILPQEQVYWERFLTKAEELAQAYGFQKIETPILEETELFVRSTGATTDIVSKQMFALKTAGDDNLALRPENTPGVLRAYLENGMINLPQPVKLYYFGQMFRYEQPQAGRYRQFYQFGIEVVGERDAVIDVQIIQFCATLFGELGLPKINFQINSLGCPHCRPGFRRALLDYYRYRKNRICPDCRRRMKENPLRLLDCKEEKCQPIKANSPAIVDYLCDECRAHFKQVLEYLDELEIPYFLDNTLVRGLDYYTRTVFEVFIEKMGDDGAVDSLALGGGGRYDNLAKSLNVKKEIPGVGVSFGVDRIVELATYAKLVPRLVKKPKVFFIQLSFDAKLHCFEVIEALRQAKIPVQHSLSKDSLSAQLGLAEKIGVPFTIILGQKEALDGTVIVRNMDSRSQDTIKVVKLAEYLKKIK